MNAKDREYSLLAQCPPPRELHVALAHCIATAKLGTARMELLNRLYLALEFKDRMACNVELRLCRMAQRGELRAEAV